MSEERNQIFEIAKKYYKKTWPKKNFVPGTTYIPVSGKVFDAWKAGVIEPLQIKTQAISSASEVTTMILRIDDVIAGGPAPQGPSQMPPGMGGMM